MATIYVAATGNDTTGNGSSGNPYATLGKAGSVFAAGDTIFLKYSATPYELTTTTANVAGGRFSFAGGSEGTVSNVVGYDTNDAVNNTDANKPTLKIPASGVDSIAVITTATYSGVRIRNLIVDGNGKTSISGFAGAISGGAFHEFCEAKNCTTGFNVGKFRSCLADTCVTGFNGLFQAFGCVSQSHTSLGFQMVSGMASHCLALGGTGGSTDGFRSDNSDTLAGYLDHCLAYGNGRDGIHFTGFTRGTVLNCLSVRNGRYDLHSESSSSASQWLHCASYGGTSGNNLTYAGQVIGLQALSAYPFVSDPPNGDFTLNDTAGGGALLQGTGFPEFLLGVLPEANLDIGALQHVVTGGGGGGNTYSRGRLVNVGG